MEGLTGTKNGNGVWQRIISEMPPHDVYIEAFFGRGAVARRKRPAAITIGIDPHPDALSCGEQLGFTMFPGSALDWLRGYFRVSSPAATNGDAAGVTAAFGGYAFRRHFVYLDPPYLGFTGYYRHELTEQQHVELCRLFLRLPCPAALSGYRNDVYDAVLDGCRSISYWTTTRAGKRVREYLWCNYDPPAELHDARFIGSGRRERERIRKRVRRWRSGLKRMHPHERQAVFEALATTCDVNTRLAGSDDRPEI